MSKLTQAFAALGPLPPVAPEVNDEGAILSVSEGDPGWAPA